MVVALAAAVVALAGHTASADLSGGGDYQTFAVVPAAAYNTPPTITSPRSGQIYQSSDPLTVSGGCSGSSLIEIFKNQVMAGAALCRGGSYSLQISLFSGTNSLVARAYNVNNFASPDSAAVNVSQPTIGGVSVPDPFYISANQTYVAAKTGQPLTWQLIISGGTAPYAVSVVWGDGNTELFSKVAPGTYSISHTYKQASPAGNYTIVIKATDMNGTTTYLQLVGLVRGPTAAVAATTTSSGSSLSQTMVEITAVMLFSLLVAIVGFWLGERHETRLLTLGQASL